MYPTLGVFAVGFDLTKMKSGFHALLLLILAWQQHVGGFYLPSRVHVVLQSSNAIQQSALRKLFLSDINEDGNDSGDDDDGWGSNNSLETKAEELRQLQQQRSLNTSKMKPATTKQTRVQGEGVERDLFIPIFALVSLAGLFGAYGYEMVRLASRGELYLPWNN